MKKYLSVLILVLFLNLGFSFATDKVNNAENTPSANSSGIKLPDGELSQYVFEMEMQSEIENEYGSEESSYFNNRENIDYESGGDAFDSCGY